MPGDQLRAYRFADVTIHTAQIINAATVKLDPGQVHECVERFIPGVPRHLFREVWRLTLNVPLVLAPGDMCANEAQAGHGFRIEGNRVFNAGSRGIVVNQSGGVVRNNCIEHTFLPGIHMFAFLREGGSGFQNDVAITGNRVGWSCRGLPLNDGWCGALCITGWDRGFQVADGHRHLLLASNTIHHALGVNLQIHCATDVVVRGNRFCATHFVKQAPGRPRPVDNHALIYLEQTAAVRFSGNTAQNLGPFAMPDALLVKGPQTSHITWDSLAPLLLQATPPANAQ